MGLRIGLVAGEASGDQLGEGLMRAIARRRPEARFAGIGGPGMQAAGLDTWWPADRLSVMGLAEVVRHLPRLLGVRRQLKQRFIQWGADVVVGIDSPDFNLGLESALRRRGVPTVHYVSPSVWAWRPGRVRKVRRATDTVLCLLPFETAAYDGTGVRAIFVGHPLADRLPEKHDKTTIRRELGLSTEGEIVAVLPGSRPGELDRLGTDFAAAIGWMSRRRPGLRFLSPMVNDDLRRRFATQLEVGAPGAPVTLIDGLSTRVMAASDVVLLASGTATLEAGLIKRPMVVAYRVAPLTEWLLKGFRMLKINRFALPNLLADEELVPEFLQDEVSPEKLGAAVLHWLDDAAARHALEGRLAELHALLRRGADEQAAEAVLSALGTGGGPA